MHGRSDGSPGWRRTLAAVAAAITIALLLGAAAGAAPASGRADRDQRAAPGSTGASSSRGAPTSASAGTTLSDGAARNADGTFHFPVTGGSYEPDTGTTVVRFGGTIVFLGHCDSAPATRAPARST